MCKKLTGFSISNPLPPIYNRREDLICEILTLPDQSTGSAYRHSTQHYHPNICEFHSNKSASKTAITMSSAELSAHALTTSNELLPPEVPSEEEIINTALNYPLNECSKKLPRIFGSQGRLLSGWKHMKEKIDQAKEERKRNDATEPEEVHPLSPFHTKSHDLGSNSGSIRTVSHQATSRTPMLEQQTQHDKKRPAKSTRGTEGMDWKWDGSWIRIDHL